MATLGAPVRVSPLIKFSRYTALVVGLLYGSSRFKTLSAKEKVIQEEEAKLAAIREAEMAEEKKRLGREEMLYLAKEAGVQVPADF
ncbi:ATP synthase, subunit E [Oratosquilla oratoria]|uniref:ATP synthase, subunit E n=1 Tax=Oratosquilla oratoria TaxID=337810 RepID=UPI003F758B26